MTLQVFGEIEKRLVLLNQRDQSRHLMIEGFVNEDVESSFDFGGDLYLFCLSQDGFQRLSTSVRPYGCRAKGLFKRTGAQPYRGIEMGKITIMLPDKVEKELRVKVAEKYGGQKGALGEAVSEALQEWLKKR
jgi:hypothetical protein